MSKIKGILLVCTLVLLAYTRFVNLSWGLPYPMHPDERNMANAVQNLKCDPDLIGIKFQISNCLNPHFFAYGQFPLYLGYVVVLLLKFFVGNLGVPISFEEAALSLRFISAIASIFNVLVLLKIVQLIISNFQFSFFLVFTFSPFFIQFSHFGTTESLLMLLYSLIVYLTIRFSQNKLSSSNPSTSLGASFYLLTSFFSGLAIATKISSVLFLVMPIALIIDQARNTILDRSITRWNWLGTRLAYFLALTLVFSILFSPHNFISFPQFLGSIKYESDVALGGYRAFYTRQFDGVSPIIFQFVKIFPYTLGWPVFIFFLLGFIFLPFKKEFNILRLAILAGFLPNAFLYAKWTRFMTPILPLMLVIAVLYVCNVIPMKMGIYKIKQFIWIPAFAGMTILMIIPGIAYLSIYQNPDVRFTTSDWIYKNIPDNSYILFETANVVDIPVINPTLNQNKYGSGSSRTDLRSGTGAKSYGIETPNYKLISFNFYDLDENPTLRSELQRHLAKADYIFIPSRRIFANHYCNTNLQFPISPSTSSGFRARSRDNFQSISNLQFSNFKKRCAFLRNKYPLLNDYYDKLFSEELGFTKVAEFSSYPKIQFFGKTLVEFPDEQAEETWTVFDHPVIRVYKRIN